MENEKTIIKVYKRIIDDLIEQVIDLKVELAYTSEMYDKLCERYNFPTLDKKERVCVMKVQNFAAQTQLEIDKLLNTPLDSDHFSVRTLNCLKDEDIYHVGDLVQRTEYDLLKTPNLGKKSLKEIKEVLATHSLSLNMEIPHWKRPAF
jgi:DNA-directed RNA polymerase alpha subunit